MFLKPVNSSFNVGITNTKQKDELSNNIYLIKCFFIILYKLSFLQKNATFTIFYCIKYFVCKKMVLMDMTRNITDEREKQLILDR